MPQLASISVERLTNSISFPRSSHSRAYSDTALCVLSQSGQDAISEALIIGLPSPPVSADDMPHAVNLGSQGCLHAHILTSSPVYESLDTHQVVSSKSSISSLPCNSQKPNTAFSCAQIKQNNDSFPFAIQHSSHRDTQRSSPICKKKVKKSKQRCFSAGTGLRTPSASPDRFISNRSYHESLSDTYRQSKSPQLLSGHERLLRQKCISPDPFYVSPTRHRGRRSPLGFDTRGNRIGDRSHMVSHASVLSLLNNPQPPQTRHPSAGAIWNVGGNSAATPTGPVRPVSDGRGGRTGSGTNAPMYTSNFFQNKAVDQNNENHEGRLAIALEINQTRKFLSASQPLENEGRIKSALTGMKRKVPYVEPRTEWINGKWDQRGSPSRRHSVDLYCKNRITGLYYQNTNNMVISNKEAAQIRVKGCSDNPL